MLNCTCLTFYSGELFHSCQQNTCLNKGKHLARRFFSTMACGRWLHGLYLLKNFQFEVAYRKGPQPDVVANQTRQEVNYNWIANDSRGSAGVQWEIIHLKTGKNPIQLQGTIHISQLQNKSYCTYIYRKHPAEQAVLTSPEVMYKRETWKFSTCQLLWALVAFRELIRFWWA